MKFKRILAMILAVAMVLSLAACKSKEEPGTNNTTSAPTSSATNPGTSTSTTTEKRTRDIYIGTWWVQHYDSADTSVEDSGDWIVNQDKEGDDEATKAANKVNRDQLTARFENVKKIEQRYGLKFYWTNLTYAGVKESINTSILAGSPDCDIYLTEAAFAIPAQIGRAHV